MWSLLTQSKHETHPLLEQAKATRYRQSEATIGLIVVIVKYQIQPIFLLGFNTSNFLGVNH